MKMRTSPPYTTRSIGLLGELARDNAGNTMAIVAAAVFPLMALVGGGIDLGRGYLAQARLQQACDSGVLAARKRMGNSLASGSDITTDAADAGNRFFNLNFRNGAYGTENRQFVMTLEVDFSVSGAASVDVPTTLMKIFGYDSIELEAECAAQLNITNTDVMMVLDTTGSMAQTNAGDSVPKIQALTTTVTSFYTQLMAAAPASSRVRFGFVPYSMNVNVGHLLQDDWVNTSWKYQTREFDITTPPGKWLYKQETRDVSNWRLESNGCIEERDTYEIADYDNVDLTKALDLDIDMVPTTDPKTKWSPQYPHIIYAREKEYDNSGQFKTSPKLTSREYINPMLIGAAACPAQSRKLAALDLAQLNAFLATLVPQGNTYHDIGMIWGGRLLSPSGIFAAENADLSPSSPTSRHLVFLTDGETATRDIGYTSYGVEPLDQRRWKPGSALSLTQTVENRFAFACEEVKKRNISVWVISFGVAANPVMEACAGPERYYVADNAAELEDTFESIAKRLGELRVTQ